MINFNPNNIRIELVRDMTTAMTFLQWIKDVPDQLIALDVETDGLDWYDGVLRLVQFGTLTEGWAVPFESFRHLVIEALGILNDRGKVFVGHNFKFDLHWIERNTGWLPRDWAYVHDTMNMAAVLNSSGAKDLKTLSEFYVWDGAKGGQKALHDDMKKYGWTWGTVPVHLPSYWIYGVLDTILTANLFYVLYDKCVRAETLEAYRTEMSAFPVLYKMERKGMLLDREHCVEKRDTLVTRARAIEAEVARYGVNNIQSTSQIALALIDAGVELTETTGSGKWKMDRDTFDIIAATNDHPLVKLIQEYRSATKMASTYYDNFLKYQRSDGRCHPQYNAVVARTGRMSASDPAILTVPRPGTNADVRNSFVAPDGHVLISTDFNNVEARIFAHFAREQGMIDAFRAGVDLHCYTAKEIFRLDEMPSKDDPRRQIAKNTLFCYPETTKALTLDGPKYVDELRIGDMVLGHDGGVLRWTPIRAIHRPGEMEVIEFGNEHRTIKATGNHRWVAERRVGHVWEPVMMTTNEFLAGSGDHRLVLSAPLVDEDRSGLTAEQAALLGWLVTDGHVRWSGVTSGRTSQAGGSKAGVQGFLAQTKELGREHIQEVLDSFIRLSGPHGFHIHPQAIRDLYMASGLERDLSNLTDVVLRMGTDQVQHFVQAVWLAEGTLTQNRIAQNEGPKYDAIRLAVFLSGKFPGRSRVVQSDYPTDHVCRSFTLGKPTMTAARVSEVSRTVEPVWCITTDLDSFVVVQDESYFLGGNCTLFGGGAAKVAVTAGIPLEEGQRSIKGLYTAFPGIKEFQQTSTMIATDNLKAHGQAFIRGVDGRILAMVETDDRYYAFTNWQIQSAANVVLKRRLAVIDAMGLADYIIAAIHDEVVAEIPEEFEPEYKLLIKEAMEDPYSFAVPIVSSTGDSAVRWGDAK